MARKSTAGHEEGDLIRRVNPDYARRAAVVVKTLESEVVGGALTHLKAVKAGLMGEELEKRTED